MRRTTRDYHRGVILFPLRYTVQQDVKRVLTALLLDVRGK